MGDDAKAKAARDVANRRAAARAAPLKAQLQNNERLEQLHREKSLAEARRDWQAVREADYEIGIRAVYANDLGARVAISKLSATDPARLEAARAKLDAERSAITSPFVQSAHDARTAAVRQEIDRRLASARTSGPGPDAMAEARKAARQEYEARKSRNPCLAAEWLKGREGLVFGDGSDPDPEAA